MDTYDALRTKFKDLVIKNHLETDEVVVHAKPLTPDEAIGNPEDRDYPLITGRERIMQAELRGACGQTFTDMYGNYSGKLIDIAGMEMTNNYRRAIFIASLNATMRYLGLADKTVHCKDEDPKECSVKLAEYVAAHYGNPKIAVAGLQPRIVEALGRRFNIRVTDLDAANINTEKYGVVIGGPEKTKENLDWCDLAVVTGTTVVNDTIGDFLGKKPVIFFGITIAGAAPLLGLERFCHCGR